MTPGTGDRELCCMGQEEAWEGTGDPRDRGQGAGEADMPPSAQCHVLTLILEALETAGSVKPGPQGKPLGALSEVSCLRAFLPPRASKVTKGPRHPQVSSPTACTVTPRPSCTVGAAVCPLHPPAEASDKPRSVSPQRVLGAETRMRFPEQSMGNWNQMVAWPRHAFLAPEVMRYERHWWPEILPGRARSRLGLGQGPRW